MFPIVIGVAAGTAWLIQYLKNKENNSGGGGEDPKKPKDPKDPKDPKKNPHGLYVNNPKHHKNSKPPISKPPKNGQKALDKSLKVKGQDYRIGVEDGKIVRFNEPRPGEYHGYIEEFKNLGKEAVDALLDAGLIKNPKTGKMLK